jgi:hypothetical protein
MNPVASARSWMDACPLLHPLAWRRSIRIAFAAVCAFAILSTDGPTLADTRPIVLEEVVSAGALDSTAVTTSAPVTAAVDALYLAVISTNRFARTTSVSGLGLQWSLLREQCGSRTRNGASLWSAQGIPAADGAVTAYLDSAVRSVALTVVRYSGAHALDPIGSVVSANTNGSQGACDWGANSSAYSVDILTRSEGAQIFSAVAIGERTHTPGPEYVEVAEVKVGTFGGAAGLATQHRTVPTAGVVPVDGSMSGSVDWAVIAVEITPGGPGDPPVYIWISDEELGALPMRGDAWDRVKATADGDLGEANLSNVKAKHDTNTLATALVYVRTGIEFYREKAADAIMSTIGTEYTGCRTPECIQIGARASSLARNLACYAIAADLIDFNDYDPVREATFRTWLNNIRHEEWEDGSLIAEDEQRANNHGRMAGASRVAVALYLGDSADLQRAADVFKGFLGDESLYDGFSYTQDLSWQADESNPVGINPLGAIKEGHSIDGALPEEMRRGDAFQFPPVHTGYPWGALQGIVVEALILSRRGYDTWNWEDRAILRALLFLRDLSIAYPESPWWAAGDDTWTPWLINWAYGSSFPTDPSVKPGKLMGFTDWTHATRAVPVPALQPSGRLGMALLLVCSAGLASWGLRRRARAISSAYFDRASRGRGRCPRR